MGERLLNIKVPPLWGQICLGNYCANLNMWLIADAAHTIWTLIEASASSQHPSEIEARVQAEHLKKFREIYFCSYFREIWIFRESNYIVGISRPRALKWYIICS